MDWIKHMSAIQDIIIDNACSIIFKILRRSKSKVIISQCHADVQWMEALDPKQKDFVTQLLEQNHMQKLYQR